MRFELMDETDLIARYESLTAKEVEALWVLARGRTIQEAADELFVGYQAVAQRLRHVYRKFGVHSLHQAVGFFWMAQAAKSAKSERQRDADLRAKLEPHRWSGDPEALAMIGIRT